MAGKLDNIPEGAYAVIVTAEGEIKVSGPDQDDGVTNGLLLMIGIARKMNDDKWVSEMINDAENYLVARQEATEEVESAS